MPAPFVTAMQIDAALRPIQRVHVAIFDPES
jgi:hypothetical protein